MNTLARCTLPKPKFTVTPDHTKSEHFYQIGNPVGGRFFSFTGYLGQHGGTKVNRIQGWSVSKAAERAYEIMITEDLTANPMRAMEARAEIKRAPKQALQKTADFGTVLHDFAEQTALGTKPLMKNYDKEVHDCIRSFKTWWKDSGLTPVAAELRVAIPDLKAAGTLDLLATGADGELVLIDFKTSKDLWLEVQGQLAACNQGLFDTFGVRASKLKVVRFGREDSVCEEGIVPNEDAAFEYFKSLVEVKQKHGALEAWV